MIPGRLKVPTVDQVLDSMTLTSRMNLHSKGQRRSAYITALRAADRGDIAPLLAFARM